MSLSKPVVHEYVKDSKRKIGKIIAVDNYWGWLTVEYANKVSKEYSLLNGTNSTLTKLTKEEYADYLLNREKTGIDDYWFEE